MTMIPIAQATDKQLNAAIAELRGWTFANNLWYGPPEHDLTGITQDVDKTPPDYLHDPRLWAGLELPRLASIHFFPDVVIVSYPVKNMVFPNEVSTKTLGRAWCLAYLAHKGVTEVEDESQDG